MTKPSPRSKPSTAVCHLVVSPGFETALAAVLKYGFIVCDQLDADTELDPELAEVKLLKALHRVKRLKG